MLPGMWAISTTTSPWLYWDLLVTRTLLRPRPEATFVWSTPMVTTPLFTLKRPDD